MKLMDVLNGEVKKVEFYVVKKPKYHRESVRYEIKENSTLCLSSFDKDNKLTKFYSVIQKRINEIFDEQVIEEYSNDFNQEPNLYLDASITFNYDNVLEQLCTPSLLEDSLSLNYLLVKAIYEKDEILIWIKLKSPLKIEEGVILNEADNFRINFTQENIGIENFPNISFNLDNLAFINYEQDFYIVNKELYQKYFDLETYYVKQVKDLIYRNNSLVLDEFLVTKSNAKMIYEYYEKIEQFIEKLATNELAIEQIETMIDQLNLSLQMSQDKQIILKTPQDLVDLLLLSSGCLGINSLTNEPFKVKKPNYLIEN